MKAVQLDDIHVHYRDEGPIDGPTVVFANSLGTDLRLWDPVLPYLPQGLRLVRYDKRGHGLTTCPPAPYSMGKLVCDAERLLDHLNVRDAVFVGLSIGGMIAQGLAVKRMDQIRAMVLSNTAMKIGTPEMWKGRIDTVQDGGIKALEASIMERWFSKAFREKPELSLWREMLVRQPDEGYIGCSAAISGTDFFSTTTSLTLPTMAIAGSEDGSTPPDLVRETADLIKGSRFELIRGAGHLPCVETPEAYAHLLTGFFKDIGHLPKS